MKALSVAAILISVGAASAAGYSFKKIDEANRQVAALVQGVGNNVYLSVDPRLAVVAEDFSIEFGQYSNKLSGKVKVKIGNDEFPLDNIRVLFNVEIKDSRGKIVAVENIHYELEGQNATFEFNDKYMIHGDRLRPSEQYDFEVVSYSWGPEQKLFSVEKKEPSS